MSRVRQFGDLRGSRSSRRQSFGHQGQTAHFQNSSSKNIHFACVNCVNRSMSQQKTQLRASQRERQNSYLLQMQKSRIQHTQRTMDSKMKRAENEKKKISEYNKNIMLMAEEKKEREKNRLMEEKKTIQKNISEYNKKLQDDKRRDGLLKENFRKDIDRQLEIKNERKLKEKEEFFGFIEDNPIEQKNIKRNKHNQQNLEKYRNDLLNQIKEDKNKKQREKNQKNNDIAANNFNLLDNVQKRNKIQHQIQRQRMRVLEEDRKRHEQLSLKKRKQQRSKKQIELKFEQQIRQKQIQRAKQIQKKRQSQIQSYLSEVKTQIQLNQQRKKRQVQWQRLTINQPFLKQRKNQEMACDGCEKVYPTNYLTKLVEL